MSDVSSNEMMINRLLVLFQLIAVPLYFVYFNYIWHDDIEAFFETDNFVLNALPDWLVWFEINLAIPVFFSLPWVIITLIRATRIADAYSLMGRALGRVRIDQKLFYGINAAFVLIFLILPFGSPMITIIAVFVATYLFFDKIKIGKISVFIWLIPAMILSLIPGLIAIAFYSNFSVLFDNVFDIWKDSIDTIFGAGLCLAIAITIGNFISFILEKGIRDNRSQLDPKRLISLIKIFLFSIFLMIFFFESIGIINFFNIVAGVLAGLEFVLRKLAKLPAEGGGANLMVFAFIVINFVINALQGSIPEAVFKGILILLSSFIFFALFLVSYKYAEDPDLIVSS